MLTLSFSIRDKQTTQHLSSWNKFQFWQRARNCKTVKCAKSILTASLFKLESIVVREGRRYRQYPSHTRGWHFRESSELLKYLKCPTHSTVSLLRLTFFVYLLFGSPLIAMRICKKSYILQPANRTLGLTIWMVNKVLLSLSSFK